jgi:peptidyl-prolyl cis-trans isomerase D
MIRFLQTPGPIKKIILSGILLIFCGAMVITLIPGGNLNLGFGGPGKGVIATVGDQKVTVQDVERQARQMLRQQFPRGGAQASMLLPFFTSRAAEDLISQKAILVEADRLGLRVSDEELLDEMQHGQYASVFFPDGKFVGKDAYETMLQRAELTVPRFEQSVKEEILFNKLRALVSGSAVVTESEVREEFDRRNTKVKFDYAVLQRDDLLKEIHPSDSELIAYYDAHKASYNNAVPEKRKVKYLLLETAKLQAQTPVTHDDLLAYYDQHREEYRVPEQVSVRQILIKTPLPGPDGKVDSKGIDEARRKAEDVLKQVKGGGNFAELAKKYSEDPGSAKDGGSLGFIGKGRTVPEFEKSAFSLPKGGTSDLVQSSYGFHIIHVDDKQDAHVKTLDEVKDQIEPVIKQQKVAKIADDEGNALLNQARSSSMEKAAASKGLEVVTTDFVGRGDSLPGIGPAPSFMDTIFSATAKNPPDEAHTTQGYVVYQVLDVKPAATPTFEEIHSRVENEFKNERVTNLLARKTQELSDRARAEHDLKKAAKELNATVKTSELVAPDGQVPDIGSLTGSAATVFTMKPGEISGPIQAGTNGVVAALLQKQEPTDQDYASKKDQIRDSLVQAKQGELFGMFVSNLREQLEKSGKIKINQAEMKALSRTPGGEEGGEGGE